MSPPSVGVEQRDPDRLAGRPDERVLVEVADRHARNDERRAGRIDAQAGRPTAVLSSPRPEAVAVGEALLRLHHPAAGLRPRPGGTVVQPVRDVRCGQERGARDPPGHRGRAVAIGPEQRPDLEQLADRDDDGRAVVEADDVVGDMQADRPTGGHLRVDQNVRHHDRPGRPWERDVEGAVMAVRPDPHVWIAAISLADPER